VKALFIVAIVSVSIGIVMGLHLREGSPTALAGGPACAAENGDANADGRIDISDAVTILGNLFSGNPPELPPLCASSPRGLPDTGQRRCFRVDGSEFECIGLLPLGCPFVGQDAQVPTGCPDDAGRFTVEASETVIDNCTGLEWQVFTADFTGDGVADQTTWCNALDYCKDLVLGGHNDWRLPNVRELESIVSYGRHSPAADPVFRAEASYWSSTTYTVAPAFAWTVSFSSGTTGPFPKTGEDVNFVRAVRGGL
jgi:uncharacterized protein DUF1566